MLDTPSRFVTPNTAILAPDLTPASPAPLVSIIIVNYNGGVDLKRCLMSLLQDPFSAQKCEIILVDNASSDNSSAYVQEAYPCVKVVCSSTNLGFGGGSNLGATVATGQYLAFLNPDTVVRLGWLEALIVALSRDPDVGLVTSKILLLADRGCINTCGNLTHYTGLTLCRGIGQDSAAFPEPDEVTAVSGAAFAMRRDLFDALGGFDECFFLYMEDTDLSWRARLAGYRCLCVPNSLVYHDYVLSFGPRKTFLLERNRYLMLLKTLHVRTLIILIPALLLAEGVTWGFALLRDRANLANKAQAYLWIVRHWRFIMKRRRRVQALRKVSDRVLIEPCEFGLAFEQMGCSWVARLAHVVFDPLFFIWQRVSLVLIEQ